MNKKTLVVGASENPARYSNKAIKMLRSYGHDVVAIGAHQGRVDTVPIDTEYPDKVSFDTITLYINPAIQNEWEEKILSVPARRIIFNPGTENVRLEKMARDKGMEVVEACTLVMLRTDQF